MASVIGLRSLPDIAHRDVPATPPDPVPSRPASSNSLRPRQLGFDLDGALWVNASHHDEYEGDVGGLARFDEPGWTILGEADGVEPWGGQGGTWISTDLLDVAPDGSFWLNGRPTAGGCGGVAHWDGTTWTSYLLDSCIHDLAIASDGSVWLRADGGEWPRGVVHPGSVHTYVIRPEAGATTE
jgi:hypothetical protein